MPLKMICRFSSSKRSSVGTRGYILLSILNVRHTTVIATVARLHSGIIG
jgi:hypothetical protein